jgi:hypothetical protein
MNDVEPVNNPNGRHAGEKHETLLLRHIVSVIHVIHNIKIIQEMKTAVNTSLPKSQDPETGSGGTDGIRTHNPYAASVVLSH